MIEWIIALSVTVVLAVIGWTLTASLSMRMKAFEIIKQDLIHMEASGAYQFEIINDKIVKVQ